MADGNQSTTSSVVSEQTRKKTPKKWTWTDDFVKCLISALLDYKVQCDFNNIDFNSDLIAMYAEVRVKLAEDFPEDFGVVVETKPSKTLKEMTKEEYGSYKNHRDKEQELIKKGKDRVKEKSKQLRQEFSKALVKGTRSGSGKIGGSRIVMANWDELMKIWGSSPSTKSLPYGVESYNHDSDCESSIAGDLERCDTPASVASDNQPDVQDSTPEPTSDGEEKPAKRMKTNNCPKLIDNKRKNLEKKLSAAQRDQVFVNAAKDDIVARQEMMKAFNECSKRSEEAMSDIATSMKSLSQGLVQGFQMLAHALATPHPPPPPAYNPSYQQFQQSYQYTAPAGNHSNHHDQSSSMLSFLDDQST